MHRWGGDGAFPSVITVFSAPNYCGQYHNKGAVILIQEAKMNIKQYKDVDHPFHLPGQIDLFAWSVPFLIEKVRDMIFVMNRKAINNEMEPMSPCSPFTQKDLANLNRLLQDQAFKPALTPEQEKKKKLYRRLRAKVICIARFSRMLSVLR